MSDFKRGERLMVDRSTPAVFVRYVGEQGDLAVIAIGSDTRLVSTVVLTREEG